MRVLVVNAGSSSLKLSLLDHDDTLITQTDLPVRDGTFDPTTVAAAIDTMPPADAVGHRVVHGGREFVQPVRLDDGVLEKLRGLVDYAPLHQPKSLLGIDAVCQARPELPAVICFDTAFHATIPDAAATYALPATWRQQFGIRRFGFHGLSHAYAARRAAQLLGTYQAGLRIVTCHLGAGASLAAVRGSRSVDTTMGFTPLEGLVMSTRSGSVDPGLLLWLNEHVGMSVGEMAEVLEHQSGLLALAGTPDMRRILAGVDRGEAPARLALEVYVHRLRAGVAAMAAALGGLDVVVFTGGVGEHAAPVRLLAAEGLAFLGVRIDRIRNAHVDHDADISAPEAPVRTLVVTSREDLEIAAAVRRTLLG